MVPRPHRQASGPLNRLSIILWPKGPAPEKHDLLIYAKSGHRPQFLKHLAEVFPKHIQIHYGQYRRKQLYEAGCRGWLAWF